VCSRGRANVPLCQDDGTWTDIPRCIEHEPGVEEQVPGLCLGIPGYCSVGFLNQQCRFDCYTGPDIDSICTADGTWAPYPTCQGDLRETQDGCDGCPGPLGGLRNRTAENIIASNTVSDRRVPKIVSDNDGGRKTIPSFAGNINIGPIDVETKPVQPTRAPATRAPATRAPATRAPATRAPATRATTSSTVVRRPVVSTFRQPGAAPPAPSVVTRAPATRPPAPPAPRPTLSLFERIKAQAKKSAGDSEASPGVSSPQVPARRRPAARPVPPPSAPLRTFGVAGTGGQFGVFDEVELEVPGQPRRKVQAFPAVPSGRRPGQPQPYGEFQTISLQ